MKEKGNLIVLSGFSGAGKGTVSKELVKNYGYQLSISATTRAPRTGELHGREYFFLSVEEFLSKVEMNGFIEYAQYVNNYYGTPRSFVEEKLEAGENVLLEIEVQGALNIKQQYPEATLIFLTTPTPQELRDRLVGRGTESIEVIEERLQRAVEEGSYIDAYDYIVCNEYGKLEECTALIHQIITSNSNLVKKQQEFVDGFRTELAGFKAE